MIGYNYVRPKKCNSYIVIKKIKMKIVNQIVKKVITICLKNIKKEKI